MTKIKNIYVFHEYGAENHYRALSWFVKGKNEYEIVFREFSILRKLAKGILTLDYNLIKKQIVNFGFIFNLIVTRNKTIIVGIAPYDWRLVFYLSFFKRHHFFYHTSNTFWDYSIYPKRLFATSKLSKKVWKDFIEKTAGIFCVTEKAASGILDNFNVSNVTVVNHSIISAYNMKENKVGFYKKVNRLNCLFSGRITKSKGISHIIKLINVLPEERFSFTFVGDGDMKDVLLQSIEGKSNCEYLGFINNPKLRDIYLKADVLLQPSIRNQTWEELFGMSIIEAMACATIPVTTDHSGPLEIIENQKTGFLFSEKDFLKKTEILLQNLVKDEKRIQQIKKQAYLNSKKYRSENIFQEWNKYLQI